MDDGGDDDIYLKVVVMAVLNQAYTRLVCSLPTYTKVGMYQCTYPQHATAVPTYPLGICDDVSMYR